jgi:hypothetical protein
MSSRDSRHRGNWHRGRLRGRPGTGGRGSGSGFDKGGRLGRLERVGGRCDDRRRRDESCGALEVRRRNPMPALLLGCHATARPEPDDDDEAR